MVRAVGKVPDRSEWSNGTVAVAHWKELRCGAVGGLADGQPAQSKTGTVAAAPAEAPEDALA